MSVERIQSGYSDEDDILSVMPRDVIACILGKLPIREAVRSSILSKKWRFYYLYIPQLVFDDLFCKGLDYFSKKKESDDNVSYHNKRCLFDEIITKSLMLHPGGLERFEVRIPYTDSTTVSNVNKWILYLSRRNIKKLTLFTYYNHTLPSYFFSWSNLTSLKLECVALSVPLEFKGFPNLDEVILTDVIFRDNCFERFIIVSSPLLRSILLHDCFGIHNYNISGSNLKSLSITARDFKSISLENAPNLSQVSISLKNSVIGAFADLDMFIGSLPQVKILRLNGKFLKFLLVENPVPAILSTSPYSFKILELKGVNFMDFNLISAVVCLLRSAPNLQELYIEASRINENQEQVSDYLKHQEHKNSLSKLHLAKLTEISGYAPEIEFIRFLLFNSPSLVTLSILVHELVRVPQALEMATKVFQFRPPSGVSIEFNGE